MPKPTLIRFEQDLWDRCAPFLSEGAMVCTLALPLQDVPLSVDEPAYTFRWPTPGAGVAVVVEEPDLAAFSVRMREHGVGLPPTEVVGGDLVPDDAHGTDPGDLVPFECPVCRTNQLRMASMLDSDEVGRAYALRTGRRYQFRACATHGGHTYLDGQDVYVLRCSGCCSLYLIGPAVKGVAYFRGEDQ